MTLAVHQQLNLLIADDHAVVREGMRHMLRLHWPEAVITEASNCRETLAALDAAPPLDLILFDLTMHDMDGFQALRCLAAHDHAAPVIVFSASDDPADMRQALSAGALGYIAKSDDKDLIVSAIRLVLSGGIYIPPALARQIADRSQESHQGSPMLSARQEQVLKHIVQGLSNQQIAQSLNLSEVTVKKYVGDIFKAFGVKNRTQAAMAARKMGYDD
ncbi:MAG: response regulator transcription factor [Hylemonella sp.]|nr:response regulator transcription factor [Hylemonella sp.]MDH5707678.1 response regulator transcription factor [Hylemonella sp.]